MTIIFSKYFIIVVTLKICDNNNKITKGEKEIEKNMEEDIC